MALKQWRFDFKPKRGTDVVWVKRGGFFSLGDKIIQINYNPNHPVTKRWAFRAQTDSYVPMDVTEKRFATKTSALRFAKTYMKRH